MAFLSRLGACACAVAAALLLAAPPAQAADRFIIVASTTSTQASGLFEHLLPVFEQKTGIDVRVVAVGTGKAVQMARAGDADVLFVHHKPSEDAFVAEGYGLPRRDVMYNDFILVGPAADPAGIRGGRDAAAAMAKVAAAGAPFASRGDDSGTHKAELTLWQTAGVDVAAASGGWYRSTGSGMGETLNTAAAMGAYALADRGTWLSFRNRGPLELLVEGDTRLFNQYGVIVVNPDRHPHVKLAEAQAFADWLVSPEGQQAIAGFTINGEPLFFPNATGG
ncbi:extracellular solute-binding protein [Caenispirillum bisanense]|uniref:extracellular solute-binding protein n=1 Tax=Caenispirillum bisanense TaxID=414052 RepID=UPI0031D82134